MTDRIDASRTAVRKFGLLFGALSVLVGAYMLYRGHGTWVWALGAAVFFWVTGLVGYPVLKPVYIGWMKFAYVLGWINTRLFLGLFFYLILTPMGLLLRLLGKDLLDEKIDKNAATYWKKREPVDPSRYERLF